MTITYITNESGYYFEVHDAIDITLLINCEVHESEKAMHDYVRLTQGFDLDDGIEEWNLHIKNHRINERGGYGPEVITEPNLEKFINEFQL